MALYYFDAETTGLDPYTSELVILQLMDEDGNTFVITDLTDLLELKEFFETNTFCGVNLKFDSKFLLHHFGIRLWDVYDCQIAEIIISGGQLAKAKGSSLKDLARKYCDVELDKSLQTSFKKGEVLTSEQLEYAVSDLKYLPQIRAAQQQQIKRLGLQEVIDLEMRCVPATTWLELSGISINLEKLTVIKERVIQERALLAEELLQELDPLPASIPVPEPEPETEGKKRKKKKKAPKRLNLNSTVQLRKVLNARGIPCKGTAEKELIKYTDNPIVKKILNYRKPTKYLSTYINPLPECIHPVTNRIHAEFWQIGAMTGRFSSEHPNLQNQPHQDEWRAIFVPAPGNKMIVADYGQIELRIIAQVSQDPAYLKAFQEGIDLHQQTADALPSIDLDAIIKIKKEDTDTEETLQKKKEAAIKKLRRGVGKTTNFKLSYGGTAVGLQEQIKLDLGIDITKEEAQEIIDNFQRLYYGATLYFDNISIQGLRELKVHTLSNRLCKFKNPTEYAMDILTSRITKEFRTKIEKEVKIQAKEQKWSKDQVQEEIEFRLQYEQPEIDKRIRKELSYQKRKIQAHVEKECKNAPIQGTGADILKTALGNLVVQLKDKPVFLCNVVHDEIVLEAPKEIAEEVAQILKNIMESAGKAYLTDIPCPVDVFTVDYWCHEGVKNNV